MAINVTPIPITSLSHAALTGVTAAQHHAPFTAADAITAVEGEATLVLAGDVSIASGKSLTVDTISELTAAAGVTIDSALIKDGWFTGAARMAIVQYTGDGSTSQAITGVGFAVKGILLSQNTGAGARAVREVLFTSTGMIDNFGGGASYSFPDQTMVSSAIIALGSDGFTVDDNGADSDPNSNGATYDAIVWG